MHTIEQFKAMHFEQKLEAIYVGLLYVHHMQQQGTVAVQGDTSVPFKAYERPPMDATHPDLIADGVTHNKDGSIWMVSKGENPKGGNPIAPGTKKRIVYGYISPVKCPNLWELGKRLLDERTFKAWEDEWKRNPYAIYNGNVADMYDEYEAREPGAGKQINFMLFSSMMQPGTTVVQE